MIQGKDAVIYFLVDDVFKLYGCASDITVQVTSGKKSIKTITSGVWDDFTYDTLGYSVTLNGILTYNAAKQTGWDLLQNQINFLKLQYKMVFTDQNSGTVRGIAGTIMIESSQLNVSASDLVKDSYTMPGCGALLVFDGANPCNIVITGLAKSGTLVTTISGTYTGSDLTTLYYVRGGNTYYPDFTHDSTTFSFNITGLLAGVYRIYVYPRCASEYVGTPNQITFSTGTGTCTTNITALSQAQSGLTVTISGTYTGAALYSLFYVLNGADPVYPTYTTGSGTFSFTITVPSYAGYTIQVYPQCSNSVIGTSRSLYFNVADPSSACAGTLTPLYGVFTLGNTMYTDAAMTAPLTGKSLIVIPSGGVYYISSAGVIGGYTGVSCSAILSHWVLLHGFSGGATATCADTPQRVWYSGSLTTGRVIYANSGMVVTVDGSYFYICAGNNGSIFNFSSGTVDSNTGSSCSTVLPIDYLVT